MDIYRRLPGLFLLAASLCATADAAALDDPTQPPNYIPVAARPGAGQGQPRWRLQSTLTGQKRNVAVINGQRLLVGQTVDGAKIISIEPGQVVLSVADEEVTLAVFPSMIERKDRPDKQP